MSLKFRFISLAIVVALATLLMARCNLTPPPPRAGDTPAPITPVVTGAPSATSTATSAGPVNGDALLAVHFLDVGQGDATLLQGPDFTILIDSGRHSANDVVPHLERLGVEALDLLIGTHPHADHIGQIPRVLGRFPVSEVWMSGDEATTATYERVLDALAEADAGYHEPRAGEIYDIGMAEVQVIHPVDLSGDLDDNSISVRVVFGEVAFLFTGDAATRAEQQMIDRGEPLRAHVLQLGHHGSRTSTGAPFLQAVEPDYAIWSAGADNSFGHPHPDVVKRLVCLGIPVFGTGDLGSITAYTDGVHIRLEVELPNGSRGPPTPMPWVCGTDGSDAPRCGADQVDINRADLSDLETIAHIGPERAQMLMGLRPFATLEDMRRIPGIGPALLEAIREQGVACIEPLP